MMFDDSPLYAPFSDTIFKKISEYWNPPMYHGIVQLF